MQLNDILKIGEVCEISGKKVRVGVYSEKNAEFLNYKGEILRNVSIGSFILIRKGFLNIIGKVEGEFSKGSFSDDLQYQELGKNFKRIIEVSILGSLNNNEFVHGLIDLPLIGNYCFIVDKLSQQKMFIKKDSNTVKLGHLIDYPEQEFELEVQSIFTSHLGIFGNTGSGKSNTLAKLFRSLFDKYESSPKFNKNAKFLFIDFNGEYKSSFENAEVFDLSTNFEEDFRGKYELGIENLYDSEFWSIILEATDKTQKPFLSSVVRKYKYAQTNGFHITKKDLAYMVYNAQESYNDLTHNIREIFELLNMQKRHENFIANIKYNSKLRKFFTQGDFSLTRNIDYDIGYSKIYYALFDNENDKEEDICMLESTNAFNQFNFILNMSYCDGIAKGFIAQHHVGPMLARSNVKLDDLNNMFDITRKRQTKPNNIEVISLVNVNTTMKKLVPMLIAKKLYNDKKRNKGKILTSTLNIVVDEAHNILSTQSNRESEVWKDYRLELFEEIIKEGRKFGVFLTIASQRPSDISDTIISQLHNYFIHRLVNEEDLKIISKSVSFLDKSSFEMIPILPAGGCVFSGVSTNFPVLAQVDILDSNVRPKSENVDISKAWG